VPRDLSEVGPEQRQFRSSVQLFGRVENTITTITAGNIGEGNTQYYPKRSSDTVSTISTVADLFEYFPLGEKSPRPNFFPQFYSLNSNPLIARISTNKQIGQIATTNYDPVTATVGVSGSTSVIQIVNATSGAANITVGDLVAGSGLPEDLLVVFPGYVAPVALPQITSQSATSNNTIKSNISPSPIPPANSSVTGTGIPEGTIITSVTTLTVAPFTSTLTLNNVVNISGAGVPIDVSLLAEIYVDQSINVARGNDITITSGETPGIQYLAVYETEPQESLLDIFWETSTSGLITDLNNAVINESSGGAALFGFNPTEFTEGLVLNGNVSASDFSIVDNFGSPIPISEFTQQLTLLSQENVAGLPVSYFTLTQPTPGVNSFNIQTNQDYFDSVYFFPFPALRNFNLVLQVEINGLLSNFPISLNLQNVSPTISAPSNGDVFDSQTNLVNITQIEAQNGSANNAASPATGQLSKIFSPGSAKFTVVENSSGTSFLEPDGTSPLFLLQPYTNVDSPDYKVIVENNQVNEIAIDRYNITVEIQDAGGGQDATSVSFIVDYGVKVENMVTKRLRSSVLAFLPGQQMRGPNDTQNVYQYVTDFEVTQGPAAALGWYRYNGPWDRDNGDGINIVTNDDLTNENLSFQNAAWNDPVSYAYPFGVAVGFLVDGADNTPGASGSTATGGGINRVGLNLTILGRVTGLRTANLTYPLTGSRMIRATTQADLDLTWRPYCKYFAGPPYNDQQTPGVNGIFPQVLFVQYDAGLEQPGLQPSGVVEIPIPDEVVNQYNWQVEL